MAAVSTATRANARPSVLVLSSSKAFSPSTSGTVGSGVAALARIKAALGGHADAASASAAFAAENAGVVCVPSGANAEGAASLAAFFKKMATQSGEAGFSEQTLRQVVTPLCIVEETIVTLVHNTQLDWLMPDIKPTNRRLTFPLVSIASLDASGQQVQSLHLHWDQGTVLRQIGLLPPSLYCKANSSECVLPVQGPRVVDALLASAEKQEQQQKLAESGLRVVPPAAEAAAGTLKQADTRRESMADVIAGVAPGPASNAAGGTRAVAAAVAARSGASQISAILSAGGATGGGEPALRPSSRVLQRPGGQTHDIFGTEAAAAAKAVPSSSTPAAVVTPNPIVGDGPTPAMRTGVQIDPRRYEQHINVFGGSEEDGGVEAQPPSTGAAAAMPRRNASYESGSEGGDAVVQGGWHSGRRTEASIRAQAAAETAIEKEAAAAGATRPTTGRRDPNARSQPEQPRPSSRVLRPPGGSATTALW